MSESLVKLMNEGMASTIPTAHQMGITVVEARRGFASSDLTAEASLDDETIARVEAQAAENGKADYTLDAAVKDAAGQIVATTRGLYQLRAHG